MDTPPLPTKEAATKNEVLPRTKESWKVRLFPSDPISSDILRRRRLRRGRAIAATTVSCTSGRGVVTS